jgi:hypothetical protein
LAPRLRTKPDQLIVAGLVALALLALGEQAPAAVAVHVSIEGRGANVRVSVDGQMHMLSSALGGGWQTVVLEQPGPLEREYQVDGSDITSTNDRNPELIGGLLDSPLYRLDAWLRDEGSLARWENLQITDLATGQPVAQTEPLPAEFRVDVDLRRPEAMARLWLVTAPDRREGLELDRDKRNARWIILRGGGLDALPRWFFPEQPAPFAAELLWLLGRSAMVAFGVGLAAIALGAALRRFGRQPTGPQSSGGPVRAGNPPQSRDSVTTEVAVFGTAIACWLLAAALVSVREYHQLPHILDAISYTFQAGQFASGQLALPAPPLVDQFKGPFEVLWQGRVFSQYPPGAPGIYAIGSVFRLEWLVGPAFCAVLIGATAWTARMLFGLGTALATLGLGVISPFVLFQAGSYLSHPLAGGLLAGALSAFVLGECRGSLRWYAVCGALLGAAFLVREIAAVLFAAPLAIRLLACRRRSALGQVVAFGVPFVFAYLAYNLRQTGSPLLLPRMLFDASDHFGFGDGVGFHTRHTLASGLANTDELLTILQFDLFGWLPLFTFGLLALPFLFRRARAWDVMALGGFLAFVVAYVGYFYHGIALGPRYYFEAVPWLLLLAARGLAVLASLAGSRLVALALVGGLTLNTFGFYLPAEMARRQDFSGLPSATPLVLSFVNSTPLGPRLSGVPDGSLVVTSDWWIYNAGLAALNCPRMPDCPVLFALAPSDNDVARLQANYPGRTVLRAAVNNGVVTLEKTDPSVAAKGSVT